MATVRLMVESGIWKLAPTSALELFLGVTLLFASLSVVLSCLLIYEHLSNYSQPILQRKIVALIMMVCVYAITSWASLCFIKESLYLDMLRDCYEAYALFMFFALCYSYLGQTSQNAMDYSRIYRVLRRKGTISHSFPVTLFCRSPLPLDSDFLSRCKWNILQYVLVKPLSSFLSILLDVLGWYHEGSFRLDSGYLYVSLARNLSVSTALYWLVLFYRATKEGLLPYHPVPKFLCVKMVLFFSFWQSVLIALLVDWNILGEIKVINYSCQEVATSIQDALICVEMFFAALAHRHAFSAQPFLFIREGEERGGEAISHIRDAINMRDLISDFNETSLGGSLLLPASHFHSHVETRESRTRVVMPSHEFIGEMEERVSGTAERGPGEQGRVGRMESADRGGGAGTRGRVLK